MLITWLVSRCDGQPEYEDQFCCGSCERKLSAQKEMPAQAGSDWRKGRERERVAPTSAFAGSQQSSGGQGDTKHTRAHSQRR